MECAGDEPEAVLAGLRAGRVAITAERDGPVLLRQDDGLVAIDADERVREQLPVGELVLAAIDGRVGRPATAIVHRALHVAETDVEDAMSEALGQGPFSLLVDLGTGTGRILELFGAGFGFFGAIIFVPRWFQVVLGSSATESGYQILPLLAGLIVSSVWEVLPSTMMPTLPPGIV